jgi:RND family efflux transporter MFP subunit
MNRSFFPAFLLTVLTAAATRAEPGIEVLSYLRPNRSIEIAAFEAGIIEEILVQPGDTVTKGRILIRLNAAVIESELAQARASAAQVGRVNAARAEERLARQRYETIKSLAERGSSNESELQKGLATLEIAQGQLETALEAQALAKLQVAQQEAQLERRILRSPIDGTVTEVVKDVAESVTQTQEGEPQYLVRIVDLNSLRAKAHIPTPHAFGIKVGGKIAIRLEDAARTMAEGKIIFVSPTVDPGTGTVEVHILLPNPGHKLVSGLPCQVIVPGS